MPTTNKPSDQTWGEVLFKVFKYIPSTIQDDLLAREIFGEFVSEIQLADFILAILL